MKRTVSTILLVILLTSMLCSAFKIMPVGAVGTIYIRADGSIDPPTANITSPDGVVYYFTNNNYDGIVVERNNIAIDGMGYSLQGLGSGDGFYLENVSNVTVRNTNIKKFYSGVFLRYPTSENIICGNNITDNEWWGVRLESSNNSIHHNNIIMNKVYGIDVSGANNNLTCNNISYTEYAGISMFSGPNILRNNTLALNRRSFRAHGNSIFELSSDVDTSNTIDGKPIYYWIDKQDMTVPSDAGCVVLVNCSNMIVENLNIAYSGEGIFLAYNNYSTIAENSIIENFYGILVEKSSNIAVHDNEVLDGEFGIQFENSTGNIYRNRVEGNDFGIILDYHSSNNYVFENNITSNWGTGILIFLWSSENHIFENNIISNYVGIDIDITSDNTVWHNNFIGNQHQAFDNPPELSNSWDSGYPSGGNYWSDLNPPDVSSGSYQNETGSDKIGDLPYIMGTNNTDRYPLIYPFGYVPSPDFNNDGIIDIFDLVRMALAFGSVPGMPNWDPYVDLNQDGIIDIFDLVVVALRFGETV